MKRSNFKYLIFDLDNTLVEHDFTNEEEELCKIMGIPCNSSFKKEFRKFMAKYAKYLRGKVDRKKFVSKLEKCIPYLGENNKSGEDLLCALTLNSTIKKVNDYSELLRVISESGYKIIAFTDWFYEEQVKVLKELGYYEYFDQIFAWDGNQYSKGDIRSINRILREDKSKYLYIGDSLECDIKLANRAGVKSVWFNPGFKKKATSEAKPDYMLDSLYNILKIV